VRKAWSGIAGCIPALPPIHKRSLNYPQKSPICCQKSPPYPPKSLSYSQKSPLYAQKSPAYASRAPYICTIAKELNKLAEETYITSGVSTKELHTLVKQPVILSKEPNILAKEPYISSKELHRTKPFLETSGCRLRPMETSGCRPRRTHCGKTQSTVQFGETNTYQTKRLVSGTTTMGWLWLVGSIKL